MKMNRMIMIGIASSHTGKDFAIEVIGDIINVEKERFRSVSGPESIFRKLKQYLSLSSKWRASHTLNVAGTCSGMA